MAKQKIKIRDIKKENYKKNLRLVLPFLSREFRPLKKTELDSEEVFKELFGDVKIELGYLKAIYEYQL